MGPQAVTRLMSSANAINGLGEVAEASCVYGDGYCGAKWSGTTVNNREIVHERPF